MTSTQYFGALHSYLQDFAVDVDLYFGNEVGTLVPALVDSFTNERSDPPPELLKSFAWREFSDMYAYAVQGLAPAKGGPFGGDFFDALDQEPKIARLPEPVRHVYLMANARYALEGGHRDYMEEPVPEGFLTVREIAMLAGMDERSVRNSMHPKSTDRLVGEAHGKRIYIPLTEAQRWLKGRRGFVPTVKPGREQEDQEGPASITLPRELAARILTTAAKEGVSVHELVSRCLTARAEQ